jgi:hypothetical protein
MKKILSQILLIALCLSCIFAFASCSKTQPEGLWENAIYNEDTTLGEGAKTVTVEFELQEKTITFSLKTDKSILGEALLDCGLIEGEEGAYGLYIKKVNGVTADYDIDQSYWAFYENGEYAMAGVDMTEIDESVTYKLAYTK